MRYLADRADRILHREVAHHHALLDHPQHQVARGDLEHRGRLAHVRVTDDHVQPPVPLGVGVGLVAGVDDRPRPGGGARHALPDVLGTLAHRVHGAAWGLDHLARTADDLPGHQERDQHVGELGELSVPADQVVLVAAVGVAGGVGVVLEEVHIPGDALVVQPALRVDQEPLEDPLPRLVVRDQIDDVVALRGGILRVAAHVEVQPRAVAQEDVAAAAPGHHLAEQVAGNLIRREASLPAERAGDAVLVLDPEDPAVHVISLGVSTNHRTRLAPHPRVVEPVETTIAGGSSLSRPRAAGWSSLSRPRSGGSSLSRPRSGWSSLSRPRAAGWSSLSRPRAAGWSSLSRPRAAGWSSLSRPRAAGWSSLSRPRAAGWSS